MMPEWHHLDSSNTMPQEQESTKKKHFKIKFQVILVKKSQVIISKKKKKKKKKKIISLSLDILSSQTVLALVTFEALTGVGVGGQMKGAFISGEQTKRAFISGEKGQIMRRKGEQRQYWGTENTRRRILDFWEKGEQAKDLYHFDWVSAYFSDASQNFPEWDTLCIRNE